MVKKILSIMLLLTLIVTPVFSFSFSDFFGKLFGKDKEEVEKEEIKLIKKENISILNISIGVDKLKNLTNSNKQIKEYFEKLEIECLRFELRKEKETEEEFVIKFNENNSIEEIYENLECKNYIEIEKELFEKIKEEGFSTKVIFKHLRDFKMNFGLLVKLRKLA